jgi:hypothetical protein
MAHGKENACFPCRVPFDAGGFYGAVRFGCGAMKAGGSALTASGVPK